MTDQFGPGDHNLSRTLALGGGKFVLSFDARGNDQSGSGGAADQRFIVTVDGVTHAGPIVTPGWNNFSINLTLAAGSHTFAFQKNDDRSFYAAGLDNVSLTGGVPEAPTWAMLIAGFGLIGTALRRRTAVAAWAATRTTIRGGQTAAPIFYRWPPLRCRWQSRAPISACRHGCPVRAPLSSPEQFLQIDPR